MNWFGEKLCVIEPKITFFEVFKGKSAVNALFCSTNVHFSEKNVITDLSDRFNHYCSHCRKKCFLRSYVCRAVPNQIKVHLKVQTLAALRPLGADLASFEATKLLRCVELFEVPAIEFGLFSALQNSDAVRNTRFL